MVVGDSINWGLYMALRNHMLINATCETNSAPPGDVYAFMTAAYLIAAIITAGSSL